MNVISKTFLKLLNVSGVNETELFSLHFHVSDPILKDALHLRLVTTEIAGGNCSEISVSLFENMLKTIESGYSDYHRDEAFPISMVISAKVLLAIYVYDNRIASEERMKNFLPVAGMLISRNKLSLLRSLSYKQAIKEICGLCRLAIASNLNVVPKILDNDHTTFEDLNLGQFSCYEVLCKLSGYLNIPDEVIIAPEYEESLISYSVRVYENII